MEIISAETIPLPRVSLVEISRDSSKPVEDPLMTNKNYHTAIVKSNQRITADGWYQDVRNFEFDFVDNIQ